MVHPFCEPCLRLSHVREISFVSCVLIACFSLECSASAPRYTSAQAQTRGDDSVADGSRHQEGKAMREQPAETERSRDPGIRSMHPRLSNENNPMLDRHKVLFEIMSMMGTPYAFSGTDTEGIDCSGFTAKIYLDALGRSLPHSTRDQYSVGEAVAVNTLRFGDLVFFDTEGASPSHVGIYVGDGIFAH